MADSTINGLPAVTDVQATDEYILMRSGASKKITADDLTAGLVGSPGAGVPTGGTANQVLAKIDSTDYNTQWVDPTAGGSDDGWTADSDTWTYASASTFTVSGDVTSRFQKGTRLRFIQTTDKYGVVASSSHSSGTTTVTIAVNTSYTLANAAISSTYYSYQLSPAGYPDWFEYTPTYTGFSAAPAAGLARFRINGRTFTVQHTFGTGTSNATGFTISVPVTAAQSISQLCARTQNNSAIESTPGLVDINATQTAIGVYRTGTAAAWTGSGTKGASFEFSFPI